FSLSYTRKVVDGLIREHEGWRVPVIVCTKGGALWLGNTGGLACDAVGLVLTANLAKAPQRTGAAVTLQDNLDPMPRFGAEAAIRREVRRVIDDFGTVGAGGHVFNLGHGISRFTPPAAVSTLVDEVHTYSRGKH